MADVPAGVEVGRVPVAEGVSLHVHRRRGRTDLAPFLLVHGLASNLRMWDGVAEGLAAAGHPVAAVDLRGHGRSDKPDGGYDFATVSADLGRVVEALGYDRPIVAGQSWGGNVVVDLAARGAVPVRGIACVDGGWIDLRRFETWEACEKAMAPPRTAGLPADDFEAMMRGRRPDWPEAGIQGALACFEVRADGTIAPWLTFERHLMILRAMWEQRVGELFPAVDVPVLLLPCADGGAPDWEARKREEVGAASAALAMSRTVWFRASHDVHAQKPGEVVEVLLRSVADGFFRS
ncbi:MAG TPA: alpha/beta hydrolase [Acidimicrobiales bacterium]|nr:alpha/beta hydrolase [Acidimicrobiales bacterium]